MQKPNVAFLGPEGTHSHEACIRRFGSRFVPRPCRTLREVFEALAGADAAVVPVENALEGPVTPTLDLLAQRTAIRVREAFALPIHNHLAVSPAITGLHAIRVVYSHPQALGQCEQWLHRHLPQADLIPVASTAEAARRAASERHASAVAGRVAIRIHGLHTLARDIQDAATNATRFLLLTGPHEPRNLPPPRRGRSNMRTLVHLILNDKPGALLNALKPFDHHGVNLSFIQSRPLPGQPWEYGFFLEANTSATSPAMRRTLHDVAEQTRVCRAIGSYPCLDLASASAPRRRLSPSRKRKPAPAC